MTNKTPTEIAYGEFQAAFDHFNRELFNGELPQALITLQRGKGFMAFFHDKRFTRVEPPHHKVDEIAMNPDHFGDSSVEWIMSVLVHEMAHQWQFHFGKPSRNGYHNACWADKMESLGLMPSANFEPGGKRTGQRMGHYIKPNGPFQLSFRRLQNAAVSFRDPAAHENIVRAQHDKAFHAENKRLLEYSVENGDVADVRKWSEEQSKKPGKRFKYKCPHCKNATWGRYDAIIYCGGYRGNLHQDEPHQMFADWHRAEQVAEINAYFTSTANDSNLEVEPDEPELVG